MNSPSAPDTVFKSLLRRSKPPSPAPSSPAILGRFPESCAQHRFRTNPRFGFAGKTRMVDDKQSIHDHDRMKTITINVSEPVYRDFQRFAKARDRTASELIRDAMEEFRERRILRSTTLADLNPVSVGRVLAPLHVDDDLLGEMLDEHDGT